MLKLALAATTALAIVGGGLAIAQSGPRTDVPRAQPDVVDVDARVDARIARIKARLALTAEQEKHWPAVQAALRDLAKQRIALRAESPRSATSAIDRMRRRADAMTARAAGLRTLADAVEPLYATLDDRQKRRITALMRAPGAMEQGPRFSEMRPYHDQHDHRGHHGRGRR